MKNNRKRLNNKGFTLIELLAVVVILAVVMGIAMNSVLTSMNKSRGGSLLDSAMIVANTFNQKYTESMVGGTGLPSNVFGGSGEPMTNGGYDFTTDAVYYLDKDLASTFNITEKNYAFVNSNTSINANADAAVTPTVRLTSGTVSANSFVHFNANTGKFVVCLFANNKGSYFVNAYKVIPVAPATSVAIGTLGVSANADTMYACSDGTKSWT